MIENTAFTLHKPSTSATRRVVSNYITVADLVSNSSTYTAEDATPYVNFVEADTAREFSLPCDIAAYKLIKTGAGNRHPYLRHGYIANPRFVFIMLYKEVSDEEKGKTKKVVSGVHAYPAQDFIGCDMSELLRTPVNEDEIIVQVFPDGSLSVLTFPRDLYKRDITAFISKLETITDFNLGDEFKTGLATYTLDSIVGHTLRFSGFKHQS